MCSDNIYQGNTILYNTDGMVMAQIKDVIPWMQLIVH